MRTPCPKWCVRDYDDRDEMAAPDEQTVLHEGPETRMRFKVPTAGWVSVTVNLERLDRGGVPGPVAVRMEGVDEVRREPLLNLGLNNVLRARDAGRFADMLRAAVVSGGPTEGFELAARETNTVPGGDPTLVCADCGHEVFVWSTPDVDRCWRCDERADVEAGVL